MADVRYARQNGPMSDWQAATAEDVRRAIDQERKQVDPALWASLASLLVEPYPSTVERFGLTECAFVVAKSGSRVVFFDDIEEDFGTADEVSGSLANCASYGPLFLALKEVIREGS